ncbi:hypothetical protein LRS13_00785 [Svornostia abyssi]|uniref:Uncharacterized protein n=1 Tax=Svornostia abyssi TaxID=2898438 RepID=A0ABY5PHH5_9ACTN|nr:hypothetical protein LRS13_00785 [Parviterribacteraceae bacterium J379]
MSAAPRPQLTFLIVTLTSELPFTRVLAASVREHHPEARAIVVRADGAAADGLPEGVESLGAAELGIAAPSPAAADLSPERTALAALVPMLERLLAEAGTVVTLAPDAVLLGRIDALLGAGTPLAILGRGGVPSPPDDGLRPDAEDLDGLDPLDFGVLMLHADDVSRDAVAAWRARMEAEAWSLPEGGALAELLEPLLSDPGAITVLDAAPHALAWWNLSAVILGTDSDGHLTADGTRVGLLRLPDFDVALPTRLHPLFNRMRVSSDPVFRELLADVSGRLLRAGARGGRREPVRLPGGPPMPPGDVRAHGRSARERRARRAAARPGGVGAVLCVPERAGGMGSRAGDDSLPRRALAVA